MIKTLNHPSEICIDKHGLIEASAGTGKTFTIENLATRIIKEKKITLDKILIVTFTEKATGELKVRIRKNLEAEIPNTHDPEILDLLHKSIDNFDQTSIYTIHGFCQNVLKEFSFEMGENFQSVVANDKEIYQQLLDIEIRKNWPAVFGEKLLSILDFLNFNKQTLVDKILGACNLMKPHKRFFLEPKPLDPNNLKFSDEIKLCNERILALIPHITIKGLESDDYGFGAVINQDSRVFFIERLTQLIKWKQDKNIPMAILPFEDLALNKRNKKDQVIKDFVSNIYEELIKINKIESDFYEQFVSWSVSEICQAAKNHKTENNLISYDDMIIKTEAILNKPPENELVINKLRSKYAYAMIDEFQDTDLFQWEIFKTIFMGNQNTEANANFLFLIGDPKQSIYRFRNADIHTYQEAKKQMEDLEKNQQAEIYALGTNFRSFDSLIKDFNACFGLKSWFASSRNNYIIGYSPSISSDKVTKDINIPRSFREPGIYLMQIDCKNKADVFNSYSEMIVQEIVRLKSDLNNKVDFGHICCLFEVKENMQYLTRKFEKHNIPYTVYKEGGLTECNEAIEISYLLEAIHDIDDKGNRAKALITPFFYIQPSELKNFENLKPEHPIVQKFSLWQNYALNRQWSKMFVSIMDETGVVKRCLEMPNGERKISNYRQIFEWLEFQINELKLNLWDICDLVNSFKGVNSGLSDEEKVMRSASESKKVKLMTIHVSKGLEFPFVFNCIYRPSKFKPHPFWIRENSQFLVVADGANTKYEPEYAKEQFEEKKRLQYVAFTRAIHSVYIPYVKESKDKDFEEIVIASVDKSPKKIITANDKIINNALPNDLNQASLLVAITPLVWNYEEVARHRLYDYINIKSYSSLMDKKEAHTPQNNIDKMDSISDDDTVEEILEETLPKGANTGNCFHKIFENISFEKVENYFQKGLDHQSLLDDSEASAIIENWMNAYSINSKWKEAVSQVVFRTLTNGFFAFDKTFRLSMLNENKRKHELEFYYSTSSTINQFDESSFIKGFIDLVFEWQGKYYILDWKSNYLEDGYEEASLENAMLKNQYDLQYQVYSVCLFQWLKNRGMQESEWLNKFGGVLYMFLRGSTENKGCYFKSGGSVETIENNLKLINQLMGKIHA